ncbi:transcriptional regulator [Reticulibacter mediterranei]|uniref:Transcriptional regulator n=1 Tax=Reticulibacter mediterranei TaxID=2778369 RepID=A0A8J3IBR8_9CHLR|nr:YafY family protein [Reticulibacter mediterranei]GHO92489.1 transcriptional regulator [Reticulibacter mediterranei]
MRADRLLSIMLLLQVHRRITARTLAQRLEVSERTIQRDMEALSVSGIPIISERGSGGGWGLLEEYRTNLTGLSESEVQALFLTRPNRLLSDLGLSQASEAAFIKLLAALPSMSRHNAEYARQRFYIDATGWRTPEEALPCLSVLQGAVWQESRLLFSYQRDAKQVERLVNPLGLVAKGSTWYLVAQIEGDIRTYRVSRIREARILPESFERPVDFDLATFWEQSTVAFKSNLPSYFVTLRALPELVPFLRNAGYYSHVEQIGEEDEEGWVKVFMRFDVESAALACLSGFGADVEVLEPEELREKIIDQARRMLAFYEQRSERREAMVERP